MTGYDFDLYEPFADDDSPLAFVSRVGDFDSDEDEDEEEDDETF